MNDVGDQGTKYVVAPEYQLHNRLKVYCEVNPPPEELYLPLGWDEDKDTGRKHYRMYFNDELENIKEIFPKVSPFNTFELIRGQTRGIKKGLFSMFQKTKKDESGQVSTI